MKRRFWIILMVFATTLGMAFALTGCDFGHKDSGKTDPSLEDPGEQGNPSEPHEHVYGEWQEEIPATHMAEGIERQYCEWRLS